MWKGIFLPIIALVVLSFGIEVKLLAQGPPIFTDTPIMLGLAGKAVRTFGTYVSKADGSMYIHPLAIPYNLSTQWQLGLIAPWVRATPDGMASRSGLGDMRLFTKIQLIQRDAKGKTFRSLLKLSQAFPTGNSQESPPLGSGAFQTTVGLVNGFITTRYGLYGEIAYQWAGNGLPDQLIYNLAVGVPILPQQYPPRQINLFLEGNGLVGLKGSHVLFLSPGIQWITGRRILLESGLQLPVVETIPENQQTRFRLTFGTRILIY